MGHAIFPTKVEIPTPRRPCAGLIPMCSSPGGGGGGGGGGGALGYLGGGAYARYQNLKIPLKH